MPMCVTEKMVDAAHRQLPGISNRVRVRHALEAAVALLPDPDAPVAVPITARVLVHVDPDHVRQQINEGIQRWCAGEPYDAEGRVLVAAIHAAIPTAVPDTRTHLWDEIRVTEQGLDGPGVTDATGQTGITVNEPKVLAGMAEIATRLQAGRSTVVGWAKNAATNGMPAPIATLAAGPVYDLDAVVAWHEAWKARA